MEKMEKKRIKMKRKKKKKKRNFCKNRRTDCLTFVELLLIINNYLWSLIPSVNNLKSGLYL
jgi:hypothetical protein